VDFNLSLSALGFWCVGIENTNQWNCRDAFH